MFTPEVMIAFITGVFGPVLLMVIKNVIERRNSKKPDMVIDALETSKLVESKIEEIRDEFKVDRVWVAQFHNGGHFYPTGKSMAKFSVIYETVSTSTNSIQPSFQNIPVNLFSKSINRLLENDVISISDYKDESVATYGLKYIAEEHGCKSGYVFSIKTIDKKFIGFIGLDYTKRKKQLTSEDINDLEVSSSSLGGVLMNGL
ncbi:hypothetical protein OAA60_04500 [Porticoccaceae bacterium]|nr:hypothetical protein [bacterium]MDB4277693.1 hypothetical protein [Gammaproteobacteria bacterium]MDB4352671.1 hypothetical protein [Porticoccaceae bacterium]